MSGISVHKDSFKHGVIYNMSTVDVYAPLRGRCHFGTQPVAMHHAFWPNIPLVPSLTEFAENCFIVHM